MSPETFTLAIIAALGTSMTGIIIGVITSRKSSAEIVSAKADAVQAKTAAIDTNTVVTQKADETLGLIKDLSQQLTKNLEQQNDDLRSDVKTLKELVSNQSQQLTQIVMNNAEIRGENTQFRLDIDHYKQLVDDLQTNVNTINTERAQEKTYIKFLEKEVADLKEAHEKALKEYQRLLADQGQTLGSTKDELKARLQEIAESKAQVAEINELRERVEALEKAVKIMTEEREALIKQIDVLTAERDAANQRAEQAERERDEARAELALEKKKQTGQLSPLPVEKTPDAT